MPEKTRRKLSIVLSVQPTGFDAVAYKGGFEANVAEIAALGYDGVELAIRDPDLVDDEALLTVVQRHGLVVPAIGTGQAWADEGLSFTDPDPGVRRAAIERIKGHLPFSARAGAVIIIGLIRGVVKCDVRQEQAMTWLAEALQECCATAFSLGVRLALEPINRYETTLINTVAQGLDLIERVGAANLGLLLDTFHMNIEEPSIEESIRLAGHHIFHFHVADSNRWYPGAAHLDFTGILEELKNTVYTGHISGEFLPLPDDKTAALEAISHIKPLLYGV